MDAAISPSASALAKEQLKVMEDLPIIGQDGSDEYADDMDEADEEVFLLKQQLAQTQKHFKKLLGKVKFVDKVHKVQILELKHRNLQLTKELLARDEKLEEKSKQIGELREYIRELQGSYPDEEDEQVALRDRQAMMREIRRLESESRALVEQNEELEESNSRLMHELEKAQERKGRAAASTDNSIEDNHRRVLEDNKHLKSKMVELSMSETNLHYKLASLEDEHDTMRQKLKDTQARIVKLEDWLDQVFQNEDYRVVTIESLASADGLSLVDVINDASKLSSSRIYTKDRTKLPDITENNLTPRARVEKNNNNSYHNRFSKAKSKDSSVATLNEESTANVKAELTRIDKSLEEMEQYKPFSKPRQKVSPRRNGGYRDIRSAQRGSNLPTINETETSIDSPEEVMDMAQSLINVKAKVAARAEEKSSSVKAATSSDSGSTLRRPSRRHRSRKIFSDDIPDKPAPPEKPQKPRRALRKSSTESNKHLSRATFINSIQVHTDSETEGGEDLDGDVSPIPDFRPAHPEPITPNTGTPTQTSPSHNTPTGSASPQPSSPQRERSRMSRPASASAQTPPPQRERSRMSRPASAVSRTSLHSGRSTGATPSPGDSPSRSRPSSAFRAETRDEEDEDMSPIPEYDDDDNDDGDGDTLLYQEPLTILSPIAESVISENSNESLRPSPIKRNKIAKSETLARGDSYKDRFNRQKTQ